MAYIAHPKRRTQAITAKATHRSRILPPKGSNLDDEIQSCPPWTRTTTTKFKASRAAVTQEGSHFVRLNPAAFLRARQSIIAMFLARLQASHFGGPQCR